MVALLPLTMSLNSLSCQFTLMLIYNVKSNENDYFVYTFPSGDNVKSNGISNLTHIDTF